MRVDDAKVQQLAGAEVLTWNVDDLDLAVSEVQGPLVVRRDGQAIKFYPFWCHPIIRGPRAYIYDPRARRFVGDHQKGEWNEIQHEPKFAGLD